MVGRSLDTGGGEEMRRMARDLDGGAVEWGLVNLVEGALGAGSEENWR